MPIIDYNGDGKPVYTNRCSPPKPKTMPPGRKCACGAVLSIYNRGHECGACSLARATKGRV